MGIKIQRKKPRMIWASFIYQVNKILPLSSRGKLKMYLNLAWMFDRLAQETSFKYYKPDENPYRVFEKDFIQKHIDGNSTVLDLGCGNGVLTNLIAEKAKRVVGIDHDKPAIERATKMFKRDNLQFHYGDALEFLNNNSTHFNVLVLSHILEHLDNPGEFLLKFKDHFDYIHIELPDFDKTILNHYRKDLKLQLVYTDNDHVTEFDRYELAGLLAQCNIEIVEAIYIFGVQQLWCKVKK